jgi:hypothetical protein
MLVVAITKPNSGAGMIHYVDEVKESLARGGLIGVRYTINPATLLPEGYELGNMSGYKTRHGVRVEG